MAGSQFRPFCLGMVLNQVLANHGVPAHSSAAATASVRLSYDHSRWIMSAKHRGFSFATRASETSNDMFAIQTLKSDEIADPFVKRKTAGSRKPSDVRLSTI